MSAEVAALAELAERIRPTVIAAERTLPVPAALRSLFPLGVLARGSHVVLRGPGSASLCMSMVAAAMAEGAWCAVVGVESWGWAAAVHAGVRPDRTVMIGEPPVQRWATVAAALVESFDLVVIDPTHQVSAADARRLAARARERGAVVVHLCVEDGRRRYRWPTQPDHTVEASSVRWSGLGDGHGHLRECRITVSAGARRGGAQRELTVVRGVDGSLVELVETAVVRQLRSIVS